MGFLRHTCVSKADVDLVYAMSADAGDVLDAERANGHGSVSKESFELPCSALTEDVDQRRSSHVFRGILDVRGQALDALRLGLILAACARRREGEAGESHPTGLLYGNALQLDVDKFRQLRGRSNQGLYAGEVDRVAPQAQFRELGELEQAFGDGLRGEAQVLAVQGKLNQLWGVEQRCGQRVCAGTAEAVGTALHVEALQPRRLGNHRRQGLRTMVFDCVEGQVKASQALRTALREGDGNVPNAIVADAVALQRQLFELRAPAVQGCSDALRARVADPPPVDVQHLDRVGATHKHSAEGLDSKGLELSLLGGFLLPAAQVARQLQNAQLRREAGLERVEDGACSIPGDVVPVQGEGLQAAFAGQVVGDGAGAAVADIVVAEAERREVRRVRERPRDGFRATAGQSCGGHAEPAHVRHGGQRLGQTPGPSVAHAVAIEAEPCHPGLRERLRDGLHATGANPVVGQA
mmetsp:Transcript_76872/g.213552  ORF Transcript_76872/g.213552 Transcript_76872/m.213552 type:complete len:466 (-) Transcript_76872:305-1702(-)